MLLLDEERVCGYAGIGAARSVVLGQEDCRHRAVMLGDDPQPCAQTGLVHRQQAAPVVERLVVGLGILSID